MIYAVFVKDLGGYRIQALCALEHDVSPERNGLHGSRKSVT